MLHSFIGLVPVVVLDVYRTVGAAEDEGFITIFDIEVLPLAGPGAAVDVQRAALLHGQYRLDLRGIQLQLEEPDFEQRYSEEEIEDGNGKTEKDTGFEVDIDGGVDQVGEAAGRTVFGVGEHGPDFRTADLTVALPNNIQDITLIIFGKI